MSKQTCPTCGGTGECTTCDERTCPTCHGKGFVGTGEACDRVYGEGATTAKLINGVVCCTACDQPLEAHAHAPQPSEAGKHDRPSEQEIAESREALKNPPIPFPAEPQSDSQGCKCGHGRWPAHLENGSCVMKSVCKCSGYAPNPIPDELTDIIQQAMLNGRHNEVDNQGWQRERTASIHAITRLYAGREAAARVDELKWVERQDLLNLLDAINARIASLREGKKPQDRAA